MTLSLIDGLQAALNETRTWREHSNVFPFALEIERQCDVNVRRPSAQCIDEQQ